MGCVNARSSSSRDLSSSKRRSSPQATLPFPHRWLSRFPALALTLLLSASCDRLGRQSCLHPATGTLSPATKDDRSQSSSLSARLRSEDEYNELNLNLHSSESSDGSNSGI
ncbi:hypothetical protein MRB53_015877 [Persea americana]|uniref:Uncharacterized protein n=1 Tax=Persea americana TaxID=3435 RepID=A0ACC2M166_PERAE|nr:hypothetical protein MRB53_015877 [Persea americana]